MKFTNEHTTKKSFLESILYTLVFDTIIAILLTAINYGDTFFINFIVSQCIGLSICTCVLIALHFSPSDRPIWQTLRVAVALITGGLYGSYLDAIVSGLGPSILFEKATLFQLLTIGVIFGSIITYLNIFKVRMGDRLHYKIDLPEKLKANSFPPMLIQPLVENAIKHGLEPKVDGGDIFISGEETKDGILRLEVIDTGSGFKEGKNFGMGLSNIRERLQSLYGNSGRLILEENQPNGLKATIEVPHGKS